MSIESASSNGPIIGIDFGTTKTMVAEYDPVKKSAKVHKLGRGGDEMPTSIYVTEEGDVLFGDDADDEGVLDSPKHIRRFKMLLGRPTATQFGKKSVTPIELAAEFLGHVRKRLESEVFHRPIERLVITVPAMFGPAQRKDLITAAGRAGFTSVELLAEPVAAGIAYCDHNTDLSTNLRFLVVDWGGGTFDLALVERNGTDECKVLGEFVAGCADIGGEDLDDELWVAVDRLVTGSGFQGLGLQPKHEWGKYRRDLTRAKESLTARSQVTINFTVDGGKLARIPFNQAKLEEVITEKIQIGASLVSELVERCRKNGSPPDFILLAGGTSRIPMIAKILEQVAGLPCRAWSEGRDAIALGAAIHANRILKNPAGAVESASTIKLNHEHKSSAVLKYKSLLEGVMLDGIVSNDEAVFLGKMRTELGLTFEEAEAIQVNILGAPIREIVKSKNDTPKTQSTDSENSYNQSASGSTGLCPKCKRPLASDGLNCFNKGCDYWPPKTPVVNQSQVNSGENKPFVNTFDQVLGTYKGRCQNQTVKPYDSATLSVIINRREGNYISGILEIKGPLTGGSRFSGSLHGDLLSIETSGGGFNIFWTGYLINNKISGKYKAIAVSFFSKLMGPKEQHGVWECTNIR